LCFKLCLLYELKGYGFAFGDTRTKHKPMHVYTNHSAT
jgi:hypothetical protein